MGRDLELTAAGDPRELAGEEVLASSSEKAGEMSREMMGDPSVDEDMTGGAKRAGVYEPVTVVRRVVKRDVIVI